MRRERTKTNYTYKLSKVNKPKKTTTCVMS